jgi:hypothetical protein
MYNKFLVPLICLVLGACIAYFVLSTRTETHTPLVSVTSIDEDTWSPKPFSQSTKKYMTDSPAGGVAYALSMLSPHLTDEAKVAISQDYQGAPNDATRKHIVAAEHVDCSLEGDAKPLCTIVYSETETRIAEGEYATVLWDSLQESGYFADKQAGGPIVLENIFCTIDSKLAQTSPGNYLYGFTCSFE